MAITRAAILNVTGYAGAELARLLLGHPNVELVSVTGRSAAGQKLSRVFPHLLGWDLTITAEPGEADIVFSALPHAESAAQLLPFIERGIKIIDLSADFRLRDAGTYAEWYYHSHPAPQKLTDAVYGLPELYREQIKTASLVANPGCYPTASILALAPAAKAGILAGDVIIDAKSGISGAGRTLVLKSHFCEAVDDVTAYAMDGHRHAPEIKQELDSASKSNIALTFTPHLVPMSRGILATAYARLSKPLSHESVRALYLDFYQDAAFTRVMAEPPHTKHTWGSNYCLIYPTVDKRSGWLVVISVLDNLVKGAAGQAVQNMNLMLGLPESTGLEALPVFP